MAVSLLTVSWAFYGSNYQLSGKSLESLQKELPADLLAELASAPKSSFSTENTFLAHLDETYGADRIKPYREKLSAAALNIQPFRLAGREIHPARVVLAGILGFVASFAISLGPVMWVLLSEIFPNSLRGMALSLVGFWNSLVAFTVTLVFPWEMAHLGSSGTYLVYGLLASLALAFILLFVPETKGKTLEELEGILVRP
jgi:hypothetical protein